MKRSSRLGGPFLPFPRWVFPYLKTDYVSHAVLNAMLMYLDPDTQALTTSYDHVAEMVGCSRRTVIRSAKRLEEIGVLVVEARTRGNRNLTNRYYVNFNNPNNFPMVTPVTPLVVTPVTLGGDTGDTTSGVTGDTQSRVKNKIERNKKGDFGKVKVDRRLLSEEDS